MNFCGGAVEHQVDEAPIMSLVQQQHQRSALEENHAQRQPQVGFSAHRNYSVKSTRSQASNSSTVGTVGNGILKINKKKLQEPQPAVPRNASARHMGNNSPPPNDHRSRSRSRSRSRGGRKSLEGRMRGMEISMPNNSDNNRHSRAHRMGVTSSSFTNSRTLDTLLKRLENGFRVMIHNGTDKSGKRVFLTLLHNRTCLLIRPVDDDEDSAPSIKFPVRAILRLEIGKTKSSVLGRPLYDHIAPMTCFSIVVKLWTEAETYFDFEASSVIEREALISTLMLVLDQLHNSSVSSPPAKTQQVADNGSGEDHAGIESGLANEKEGNVVTQLLSNRRTANKSKPLRQRQLQPVVLSGDEVHDAATSPRTPRIYQSSPKFENAIKPAAPFHSSKVKSAPKSPHNANSPLEVVMLRSNANTHNANDEQREKPEEDGIMILDIQPPDVSGSGEIELGLEGDDNSHIDVSSQGLPMSKIRFSPTRDFADSNSKGRCSLKPNNDNTMNGNLHRHPAWCTDDICTLALKDLAETCTGMFDPPETFPSREGVGTGNNDMFFKDDAELSATCRPGCTGEERVIMEEYIAGVLAGPNGGLGGLFSENQAWDTANNRGAPNKDKCAKNYIRNRAFLRNGQAMRLHKLRNEMTFAAAMRRSTEKMQFVQTTKSLDDADGERLRQTQERRSSHIPSSALIGGMLRNTAANTSGTDEDAVYYDSDPEDSRPRTRGVRRASANRRNAVAAGEAEHHKCRPVLSDPGFENIGVGKKLKKLDEDLIIQIVQVMRNETLTLMWHPTQTPQHHNRSPICVNLWIESGVYLVDGSFLLPRLSWSVAYENDLDCKKLNIGKTEPEQIDLLDVCRIRVTEKINRKLHPFANAHKAFVVETQEDVYLFEAQTTEERDKIVYGYKLVIARLASLLMLRDSRAVEEFFGSASAMVPGGFTVGK